MPGDEFSCGFSDDAGGTLRTSLAVFSVARSGGCTLGGVAAGGMNASALIPIGVGLVALVAVSGALKRRRR